MGEVALRRLQAGLETTRGTAVTATRKLYGVMEPSRSQDRRYAQEERGTLIDKFRANAKLVVAGYKFTGDVLFEDMPYWLDTSWAGGVVPTKPDLTATPAAGSGYAWTYVGAVAADNLNTRTFEWGDDATSWRGAFGTTDSMEISMTLDDALKMSLSGFVSEWVPQNSTGPFGNGLFAGFTGVNTVPSGDGTNAPISDRAVESVMGWQCRLFVDAATGTVGTTALTGRFISATMTFNNQNKTKTFADGSPFFSKLGRGRRITSCQFVFEASDTVQVQDLFETVNANIPPRRRIVRIQAVGSPIVNTNFGVTTAAITAGASVSSIAVAGGTAFALPAGSNIVIGAGGPSFFVPAAVAAGAVAIPVTTAYASVAAANTSTILLAKTINFDFYGVFEGALTWAARDTNTTFQMTLMGVYDSTAGKEAQIQVINGLNAAAGIS